MPRTIIRPATGTDRKTLVNTLSTLLNANPRYCGAPTFAYDFGVCKVLRDSCIEPAPSLHPSAIRKIAELLADNGFSCEIETDETCPAPEPAFESTPSLYNEAFAYTVRIKKELLNDAAFSNLCRIIAAKRELLLKAFNATDLPIIQDDSTIAFAWFPADTNSQDERDAYQMLIEKLVEFSNRATRVLGTDTNYDNPKYAMRCWLLRLGFIGDEYKSARKILLRNLKGSSAFASRTAPASKSTTATESR